MYALLLTQDPDERAVLSIVLQRAGLAVTTANELERAMRTWPERPTDLIVLALPTAEAQLAALRTVVARALSVRQTEELVRRLKAERREPRPKQSLPPELQALEEDFRQRLGTKVQLFRNRKGRGRLVIHFYNQEDLEALYDAIVEGS